MKKSLFWLICSCALLITWPAQAAPCPKGNLQETAYMERDKDKRCEGVGTMDTTGSLESKNKSTTVEKCATNSGN